MPRPQDSDGDDDTIVPSTEPGEPGAPTPAVSPPAVPPPLPLPPAAAARPRASRTTAAQRESHALVWATQQEALRRKFPLVSELGTHLRWQMLAASTAPSDARAYIYALAPVQITPVLQQLWRAGMSVDGVSFDGRWLHVVIRSPDQLVPFKALLRWLNGFSATVGWSGVPPPPWVLTVALSTIERIQLADSPHPAAN